MMDVVGQLFDDWDYFVTTFFRCNKFTRYTAPIITPSMIPQAHHGKTLKLFPMITMMTVIGKMPIPVVQVKVHQETLVIPARN